ASLRDLVAADERLGAEAAELVADGVGVQMRRSRGGAGPDALRVQVESYMSMLAEERAQIEP
ncbi:MAG: argininosuccinate lyase, partial [Actinomycetota bacterium]